MNKRQAKKQFKKKYGITQKQAAEQITEAVEAVQQIDWGKISKNMSEAMKNACETISNTLQKMVDWVKGMQEDIANMPEEEYRRWMNSDEISSEAKAWLMLIRQQSLRNDMQAQEAAVEKIPKQTEVNRSNCH